MGEARERGAEAPLRDLLTELPAHLPPGWSPGWSGGEVSVTPRNPQDGRFSVTWLEGYGRFAAAHRPRGSASWESRAEFEPGPGAARALADWMVQRARA